MKRLTIFLSAMCIVSGLMAQSFDKLMYTVAENNKQLKAQMKSNQSVVESMKAENVLSSPEVGFEHNWSNRGLGTKWAVSVSQNFDWPGVYGKRGKAIDATQSAMDYLNRSNHVDKLLEIKQSMIDVVYVNSLIDLYEQVRQNMTELSDKYRLAYKNGEVSILDVNKLRIQCVAVDRRLSQLEIQRRVLRSTIETLNGGKDCREIMVQLVAYPQEKLYDEDYYANQINEFDPEIGYNTFMAQSKKHIVSAAKMSRYPGFSLGYKYTNELGEVFNGFTIGISLPFFSQKNKIRASQAIAESGDYELEQLRIQKLVSMYAQRQKAVTLLREMKEYELVFENSDNMDLLKKALDGGEISLIDYLQEVNFFLSARQDYMEVIYQYHLALAGLNKYGLLEGVAENISDK